MSMDREQYRYYDDPPNPWWVMALKVVGTLFLVFVLFGGAYLGVKWLADATNRALGGSDTTATTITPGIPVEVEIPPGSSAGAIAEILEQAGVVPSATEFEREVRSERVADRLQAGTYDLVTGMPLADVIAALLEGPGDIGFRITVIEGLTVAQMLLQLADQTDFEAGEFTDPLLDGTVTSNLLRGEPDELRDWEGLLFPDTYEISDRDGPAEILQAMADNAEARVGAVDWEQLEEPGLTVYDGIVIASLIEREAALDEERPIIASVIFNRLAIDMPLQIDATIVYALGGLPEGGLTLEDLEVESPYNTYTFIGLPPTPISGVRPASLAAAAVPAETDYLFYVLADEDGSHAFTDDFDEFLRLQAEAREAGVIP